jgi:Arc/MetJ-type ribon-helix-helix transcriptional regulator
MTIDLSNLPEPLLTFLRTQVAAGGYPSEQEYLAALLQREADAASPQKKEEVSDEDIRRRVQTFHEEMYQAGVLLEPRPIATERGKDDRKLIKIQGEPLSETIIRERR